MKYLLSITGLLLTLVVTSSCNNQSATPGDSDAKPVSIHEENVTYSADGVTMDGYVAYNGNQEGARPGIIVIPEWWGLNDYAKRRARELADLGYIALAMDMYGNGKTADNPDSAGAFATPFYQHPDLAKAHFDAALAKLKSFSQTDTTRLGAMGYCFGGGMVLNIARLGEDLDGVVSFHGNLVGVPADKEKLKAKILVCHGEDDPFVPQTEVAEFRKQMDSIGADYTFRQYAGAVHAFTNPGATAMGQRFNIPIAYNAEADTASWNDMKTFFAGLFK